jgi:ABC-2 type transport system ATP-binding protein
MPTAMHLEVESISKRFDAVQAVDGVSFAVQRGEILGFLGPNGAGKTTTIRMILGIFRPDAGTIRSSLASDTNAVPKERTGYLPEERGLYGDARVLDLLAYFAELKGMPRQEARARAQEWLARFELTDWSKKKVDRLSKGMQQKAQFIAAVLHRPDLVVLDEPFAGLDPVNQDLLRSMILELRDEGAAVLLSSHQMNQVEALCDRIFLIHRGRRVLYGRLDEIREAHGEHAVCLRFDGEGTQLMEMPGVEDVRIAGDRAVCTLTQEVPPNDFVRGIPRSLLIREISVARPPLHDIFVRTVAGRDDEAD